MTDKRVDFTYDLAGQWDEMARYTGATHVATSDYTYDAAGRLTELEHDAEIATDVIYAWSYDKSNRVTGFSNSAYSDENTTYVYDASGQLTNTDVSVGTDESFTYDDNGNRTGGSIDIGDGNRLAEDADYEYTYDDEGNLIRRDDKSDSSYSTYAWDYRNRLTTVTQYDGSSQFLFAIDYRYDVFNQRIARGKAIEVESVEETTWERFIYDGQHVVLDFIQPYGVSESLNHRYLNGPQVDQVLAQENVGETGSDRVYWMMADNLGTTRDLLDNTGALEEHYTYKAFGQLISGDPAKTRYLYTSREYDTDTGLQYNRARWYDSGTGRWLSEDPIGFAGDRSNLYRYVGNGVTYRTDPSGLESANALASKLILFYFANVGGSGLPQFPVNFGTDAFGSVPTFINGTVKPFNASIKHDIRQLVWAKVAQGEGQGTGTTFGYKVGVASTELDTQDITDPGWLLGKVLNGANPGVDVLYSVDYSWCNDPDNGVMIGGKISATYFWRDEIDFQSWSEADWEGIKGRFSDLLEGLLDAYLDQGAGLPYRTVISYKRNDSWTEESPVP